MTGKIEINDLVFGVHAVFMSVVQLTQVFMYDTGKQGKVNYWVVAFLTVMFITIFSIFFVETSNPEMNQEYGTIRMAGYSKAAVTLVKYMP